MFGFLIQLFYDLFYTMNFRADELLLWGYLLFFLVITVDKAKEVLKLRVDEWVGFGVVDYFVDVVFYLTVLLFKYLFHVESYKILGFYSGVLWKGPCCFYWGGVWVCCADVLLSLKEGSSTVVVVPFLEWLLLKRSLCLYLGIDWVTVVDAGVALASAQDLDYIFLHPLILFNYFISIFIISEQWLLKTNWISGYLSIILKNAMKWDDSITTFSKSSFSFTLQHSKYCWIWLSYRKFSSAPKDNYVLKDFLTCSLNFVEKTTLSLVCSEFSLLFLLCLLFVTSFANSSWQESIDE